MTDYYPDEPWGVRLWRWRTEVMYWSQQDLVDRIIKNAYENREDRGTRVDTRLVSKWENGDVQRPQAVYQRILRRLGAPLPSTQIRPNPVVSSGETVGNDQSENGDLSVFRRDVVLLGTGATVAGFLDGLRISDTQADKRIGTSAIEAMRRRIERLRKLDDTFGGEDTYHIYQADIENTIRALGNGTQSGIISNELLSVLSEQMQLAGWAAFDAGWHQVASQLYNKSYLAATESGEIALAANALAFRAYQLVGNGDHAHAVEFTEQSLALAEKSRNLSVQALLYDRAAWAYAKSGMAVNAAKSLDSAQRALNGAERDTVPDYAAWVDNNELQIMTGRCWTELRRPLRAVPVLESALNEYGNDHARDKALYLTWLAVAYLEAGEPEQAAEVLFQALELSGDVNSARPQQRIDLVIRLLADYSTLPGVSRLLTRYRLDNPR